MSHPNAAGGHEHAPSSVGPVWTRRILGAFFVLCAISVVAEFFADRHTEHPWEPLFAFYPLWGFVGIVVLVFLSRVLRGIVMRGEDYYDG